MRATKTVPEQVQDIEVQSIAIDIRQKLVSTQYIENGEPKGWSADITTEWNAMTTQQKTIVRAFLKGIVKKCLSVSDSDITGEVL